MKEKVDKAKLEPVKKHNDELKELLGKEPKDTTAIKTKIEELNKEMQAIGTEIYQKAQQEAANKQGETGTESKAEEKGPGKDEKVVDADYEVKDEKKDEEEKK